MDYVEIEARLVGAKVDGIQYKPFSPDVEFDNLYVSVPVPNTATYVKSVTMVGKGKVKKQKVVLTPAGHAYLLDQLRISLDKQYQESMRK